MPAPGTPRAPMPAMPSPTARPRLDRSILVRLTADEAANVRSAAARAGLPLSPWLRAAARGQAAIDLGGEVRWQPGPPLPGGARAVRLSARLTADELATVQRARAGVAPDRPLADWLRRAWHLQAQRGR